ncbi:MAG: caspase domain-containing protein [Kofleriaceae bacterium]
MQGPATYALIVGANRGGPGQTDLAYAEHDARRMGAMLQELGDVRADAIEIVLGPTPEQLRDRLARLEARLAGDRAAGRQTRLLFYYSGHARASALDLGSAQLSLAELRQRLFSMNTTLTVVVLDACQSGAFSTAKGASPAVDFSINSRQQLDAAGIAVLASSSGTELSQESAQLKSSYFTHHLLVGMRGAADDNHDGRVSIDEAYRYAYHQTLLATAETAVGSQHVTLEVDLKGHGEVALSFPRAATSTIVLPAALEGKALVSDRRAKAVIAETYKAKGSPVRIAVAPGDYDILVRSNDRLSRCPVSAGRGEVTVELGHCTTEQLAATTRKGGGFERATRIELSGFLGVERHDDYSQTLGDFGYQEDVSLPRPGVAISVLRQIERRLWVGARASYWDAPAWDRDTAMKPLEIDWDTTTTELVARGQQPFGRSRFGAYVQVGAGIALGRSRFSDVTGRVDRDRFFGPALSIATGLYGESWWLPGAAVSAGYAFDYAATLDNLLGQTHASGGHRVTIGLSYSL